MIDGWFPPFPLPVATSLVPRILLEILELGLEPFGVGRQLVRRLLQFINAVVDLIDVVEDRLQLVILFVERVQRLHHVRRYHFQLRVLGDGLLVETLQQPVVRVGGRQLLLQVLAGLLEHGVSQVAQIRIVRVQRLEAARAGGERGAALGRVASRALLRRQILDRRGLALGILLRRLHGNRRRSQFRDESVEAAEQFSRNRSRSGNARTFQRAFERVRREDGDLG